MIPDYQISFYFNPWIQRPLWGHLITGSNSVEQSDPSDISPTMSISDPQWILFPFNIFIYIQKLLLTIICCLIWDIGDQQNGLSVLFKSKERIEGIKWISLIRISPIRISCRPSFMASWIPFPKQSSDSAHSGGVGLCWASRITFLSRSSSL